MTMLFLLLWLTQPHIYLSFYESFSLELESRNKLKFKSSTSRDKFAHGLVLTTFKRPYYLVLRSWSSLVASRHNKDKILMEKCVVIQCATQWTYDLLTVNKIVNSGLQIYQSAFFCYSQQFFCLLTRHSFTVTRYESEQQVVLFTPRPK